MKKSLLALTVIFALLIPLNATAAVKAGASCKKAGQTSTYLGKKYTCIKSGKKLVWNKGVVVPTPKPSVTPTPTAIGDPIGAIGSTPTPLPTTTTPTPTPTPTRTIDPTRAVQGQACIRNSGDVVGYNDQKILVVLMCNQFDDRYFPRPGGRPVDQDTGEVAPPVPPKGNEPTVPSGELRPYVKPPVVTSKPLTELTSSSAFEDLTSCRLPDGDPNLTNMTVGFPLPQGRVNFTKKTIVQILPVSFSDVTSETNPGSDYKKPIEVMKTFWENQSFVGSEIEVRTPQKYKQLPKTVLEYELTSGLYGFESRKYSDFVRFVVSQYDSEIDFSKVETVVVVFPLATTQEQIGTWVVDTQNTFVTSEGSIFNYMLAGKGVTKTDSSAWVHEYGHALGLTDMRFVDSVNSNIQRPEGLGVFDVMGSGSTVPEILLWSRFLINVLAPKQVLCISQPSTSTHWIRPLEQRDTELKGLIIPTGTFTAITIESRRSYGWDSFLSPKDQGVLVYTVDTRVPYKRSPMQILAPLRSLDREWYTDSALKAGESVISNGWKITVVESGDFGDVVKVEKVG
jgi:M6 family metalloprotease-like protein